MACPDLDIDEKVWSGSPVGWVVEGRALVRKDVEIASGRIGRFVRRTPVVRVTWDSSGRPREVWFKLEHLQHTGSFKARGALNRVLGAAERGQIGPAGVVAASGGNAGVAFAYAARKAGTTSRISCLPTPRSSRWTS